jgi:hypothetical protein
MRGRKPQQAGSSYKRDPPGHKRDQDYGCKPKKLRQFLRELGYGRGRRKRLVHLPGSIRGLELGGAQLDPDMTVRNIPAHLGFEREHGSQQAQKNAHCGDLPMPLPLPHIPSLPPVR